jgi:hypothetical protein
MVGRGEIHNLRHPASTGTRGHHAGQVGRRIAFDRETYARRNVVERCVRVGVALALVRPERFLPWGPGPTTPTPVTTTASSTQLLRKTHSGILRFPFL